MNRTKTRLGIYRGPVELVGGGTRSHECGCTSALAGGTEFQGMVHRVSGGLSSKDFSRGRHDPVATAPAVLEGDTG